MKAVKVLILAFLLCFELITQFDELLTLAQSVKHTTM